MCRPSGGAYMCVGPLGGTLILKEGRNISNTYRPGRSKYSMNSPEARAFMVYLVLDNGQSVDMYRSCFISGVERSNWGKKRWEYDTQGSRVITDLSTN